MSLQHKITKPRSQRGKRFLKNREAKLFENPKTVLAIRTNSANDQVVRIVKDLSALKKPDSAFLGRKHDLRPFENEQLMESMSTKYDSALLLSGSHNKKRPNCVTFARMFDHHILDMFEFCVEHFKSISDFPGLSPPLGNKPLVIFRGESFEHDPVYQKIRSLFIDYFRGPVVDKIRPSGVTHCITFTSMNGRILMRTFMIDGLSEGSGGTTANVTLSPMGPSMDLVPKRNRLPSDHLWKNACRAPKEIKIKKRKNVSQDPFGSTLGRIHMETQDYSRLNVKKAKGLRPDKRNTGESQPEAMDTTAAAVVDYADIGGDVD